MAMVRGRQWDEGHFGAGESHEGGHLANQGGTAGICLVPVTFFLLQGWDFFILFDFEEEFV